MMKYYYLFLLLTAIWNSSAARNCSYEDEWPCLTSGDCIHQLKWCNRELNCKDGSDEYFCNVDSCPGSLFHCKNRKCIPGVAVCNGFDNCGDFSDEICPTVTIESLLAVDPDGIQLHGTSPNKSVAVATAADYLLRTVQTDGGSNSLIPRAVVALAFAERAGFLPKKWLPLLKKEVDIKVKIELMKNGNKPNHHDLAHYINALYATCQDPRSFQGRDLVNLLRSEVNARRTTNLPFVLLTLCIAQEVEDWHLQSLKRMYYKAGDDTLGSKALIIMALECISNTRGTRDALRTEFVDFARSTYSQLGSFDIYTKALHIQAMNALRYKTDVDLSTHQQPDGSFGDMLATYYAIPALLNTSLLDLKCKNSGYKGRPVAISLANRGSQLTITYSLWIEGSTNNDSHSITVSLEGLKSFYDVMKMAAARNSVFRFLYEKTTDGKKVYSIADIPDDVEWGKCWSLYRGRGDRVNLHSKKHLTKLEQGTDAIFPAAGDHFVFWYEHCSSRTTY